MSDEKPASFFRSLDEGSSGLSSAIDNLGESIRDLIVKQDELLARLDPDSEENVDRVAREMLERAWASGLTVFEGRTAEDNLTAARILARHVLRVLSGKAAA